MFVLDKNATLLNTVTTLILSIELIATEQLMFTKVHHYNEGNRKRNLRNSPYDFITSMC